MSNSRVLEIIRLYGAAEAEEANYKTMCQDIANLCFPRENQIVTVTSPGTDRSGPIYDPTAIMAKDDMATGLSSVLFPFGQHFHDIKMARRDDNDDEQVKRGLGIINEITHEKRAVSNFLVEAGETLKSIACFGTGNLFSRFVPGTGLNYRDWDIGQYVIIENNLGIIDGVMMVLRWTAQQAYDEWGDTIGVTPMKALSSAKPEDAIKKFKFIVSIMPRKTRNRRLSNVTNMPWAYEVVNVDDKVLVSESGFEEFPHFVSRWSKSSNETWGRGQGVTALPAMRRLQQIYSDFLECGEKWNNPPREVQNDFEGTVRVGPGANNWVNQVGTIKAIDQGMRGNFPYTVEVLGMERQIIKELFLNDLFMPITPLKGDRRNQMEISERITESLKRIGSPVNRLQEEWIKPQVSRDIKLLWRNGAFNGIPGLDRIAGQEFKITLLGPVAMQLKNWQAQGALNWMAQGAELKQSFPGIDDNIDVDSAFRRVGESYGVATEDMATTDDVNQRREVRAQQVAQEQAMKMAEMAGKAYPGTTKAPEAGSPAEALVGA